MTECGGVVTIQQPHHKNESCGTTIANSEIKIMDPDNRKTLGPNQIGEVCIRVAMVMNGYYRNPEATKNIFDEEGKKCSKNVDKIKSDDNVLKITTGIIFRMAAFGGSRLRRCRR